MRRTSFHGIDWTQADLSPVEKLPLSLEEKRDVEFSAGLGENLREFARHALEDISNGKPKIDFAYAASHLLDIVPNPWVGYEFVERVFDKLSTNGRRRNKSSPTILCSSLKQCGRN